MSELNAVEEAFCALIGVIIRVDITLFFIWIAKLLIEGIFF